MVDCASADPRWEGCCHDECRCLLNILFADLFGCDPDSYVVSLHTDGYVAPPRVPPHRPIARKAAVTMYQRRGNSCRSLPAVALLVMCALVTGTRSSASSRERPAQTNKQTATPMPGQDDYVGQ